MYHAQSLELSDHMLFASRALGEVRRLLDAWGLKTLTSKKRPAFSLPRILVL